jgi:hypothetical protein
LRPSALDGGKMIIGTVTVTRAMVLAALAVVSFLLAFADLPVGFGLRVPTPGFLAVEFLISRGHYFSSILGWLALYAAIDWIFWFAVMCGIYFPVAKLGEWSKRAPKREDV